MQIKNHIEFHCFNNFTIIKSNLEAFLGLIFSLYVFLGVTNFISSVSSKKSVCSISIGSPSAKLILK